MPMAVVRIRKMAVRMNQRQMPMRVAVTLPRQRHAVVRMLMMRVAGSMFVIMGVFHGHM